MIEHPPALEAHLVEPGATKTNYPEPFAARVDGRTKRRLGDAFGLGSFGVNLTCLEPGAISALKHAHTVQDEFVYVLSGELTLVAGDQELLLKPGMCAGFPRNTGIAHHLINRSTAPAEYLEIGDRNGSDEVSYPDDDLMGVRRDGQWQFLHKDGTPY